MAESQTDPKRTMKSVDYTAQVNSLERKMRYLKRNIAGISNIKLEDIPDHEAETFEAKFLAAKEDWMDFRSAWDQRDSLHLLIGDSDKFPTKEWENLHDSLRNEIIAANGILISLKNRVASKRVLRTEETQASLSRHCGSELAKIPIPTFSGDLIQWIHFRDTFRSMVHNRTTLSKVEKFHYLISALKGEASALISKFPISEDSYDQAWDKVVHTFDNPRVLARLLVHRIVDCEIKSTKTEFQRYEMFLTGVADSIEAFKALKLDNACEFILSTLALRALDPETRKQFELSRNSSKDLPNAEDVINFVRQRKLALNMSQDVLTSSSRFTTSSANKSLLGPSRTYPSRTSSKYNAVSFHTTSDSRDSEEVKPRKQNPESVNFPHCLHCQGSHSIAKCEDFPKLPLETRTNKIRSWKVCSNCLHKGHSANNCRSKYRCRHCRKNHHTLLHRDLRIIKKNEETPKKEVIAGPHTEEKSFIGFGSTKQVSCSNSVVLLGTVRTLIRGPRGDFHSAHALLDSGSQHTFMTYALAKRIGAKICPSKVSISSLAGSPLPTQLVKGSTQCVLRTYVGDKEFEVNPLVIDHITSELPNVTLPTPLTDKFMHLPLADHQFGEPKSIDILLGGDIFHQIIAGASMPSDVEGLSLIPTTFGLVVTGSLKGTSPSSHLTFFVERDLSIEGQLRAFWETEEPNQVDRTNPEDAMCEEIFVKTHARDSTGRFTVQQPFKEGISLGENKDIAYRRFYALENRFPKDPVFRSKYVHFMQEYLELGHMSPAKTKSQYLIPHHGVWQEGPHGDKKLRVVFDASCPSSTSYSLNDALLSGPKLQEDLCNVLIRFRLFAIPLCADIVKMYRQVIIHKDDRKFQHILWRDSPSKAIQEMELNTVTYGLKPSAYQALRVVRQLVEDHKSEFPLAGSRVLQNSYVDDICTGADSLSEALKLQKELRALFAKGGFTLSKWASSEPVLLSNCEEQTQCVSIQVDDTTKILGLLWNSPNDSFSYAVKTPDSNRITKRRILSSIARIFDPLGLLAPVIFTAKSLLQDVWKAKTEWDDELPCELRIAWKELTKDWHILSTIHVPRYATNPRATCHLVGFCDASLKGYSAALYLHSEAEDGEIKVSLIKAKTKVAPLKFTSVPRLELCGAVLLARLVSSIPHAIAKSVSCFTDSQVVLSWLNTPIHELKVFEANRVSQILSIVPARRWHHVASEENPADLASRGCSPGTLKTLELWWSGPPWLRTSIVDWANSTEDSETVALISTAAKVDTPDDSWMSRFSSYRTLIRTVARILRLASRRSLVSLLTAPISADELKEAELRCAHLVQRAQLPSSFYKDPPSIPKEYIQLHPLLDERGILRVGGRLRSSLLEYSMKHPILLPRKSHLAQLIVDHMHSTHFHSGPLLTLALLRGKFWLPKAAKFIRGRILRCVHCRMLKAKPFTPLMSDLPKERFNQFRAFTQVGVDYAGPFLIKESKRRNASLGKAYLCLFVCLSSKALHLETVSSLTTPAFLDALERFMARRGTPNTIWSDHGTNFIGASRFLKDVYALQRRMESDIVESLSPHGVNWKFIPPRAPHFGGLWEAGIKSVKGLLSNSIGKQPLTFEGLATAFTKIEFLLNSRPLCALSEDPNNYDFLTPGHLLIGAPLAQLLPDTQCEDHSSHSLLPRWRTVKAQISSIWERWRKEYLHSLQLRTKWNRQRPNLKPGELVILQERKYQLGRWPVGRITKTHPGRDGVTRVVDVQTPSGKTMTRAVTSIVPLFLPDTEDRSGV